MIYFRGSVTFNLWRVEYDKTQYFSTNLFEFRHLEAMSLSALINRLIQGLLQNGKEGTQVLHTKLQLNIFIFEALTEVYYCH